MLQRTITIAAKEGIKNIQIGMAHRGRLNVLTHVLEKPYEMMISEFMHTDPMKFLPEDGSLQLTAGWTGDVKYHLGGIKTTDSYGTMQRIALANNPSHLEIVAPVVEGVREQHKMIHNVLGLRRLIIIKQCQLLYMAMLFILVKELTSKQ